MPVESHSLAQEFPELKDRIHALKASDGHFARMFGEYNTVEHAIQRIESGAETSSDEWLESLKKERLKLKDMLYSAMRNAA